LLPPVREAAAAQPGQSLHGSGIGARPGCGVGSGAPAGVSQLCESFDSDFDHLERELEADEEVSSTAAAAAAAGTGQHVRGSNESVPPVVPWQAAIAAAAAAGGQQAMWGAVQAAAAAAVKKHAGKAAVTAEQVASGNAHGSNTAPGSSSFTTDRGAALRPPALHIPTPAAVLVSATPAAVSPTAAVKAATSAKAKQPSRKVSPLPSRPTAVASSKQQQQQTRAAADTTAKTPPGE
jgi:hypothetical protein